jgi:hypothetical protein
MGDAHSAARRFSEGFVLASDQGYPPLACETTGGMAVSALLQGQLDEAQKYAHDAWDYLKEHGWMGISSPGTVYRDCAETFDALGEADNAREVIEVAHQELLKIAETISIPAWRSSYLVNVPDNRWLMEMWERQHP